MNRNLRMPVGTVVAALLLFHAVPCEAQQRRGGAPGQMNGPIMVMQGPAAGMPGFTFGFMQFGPQGMGNPGMAGFNFGQQMAQQGRMMGMQGMQFGMNMARMGPQGNGQQALRAGGGQIRGPYFFFGRMKPEDVMERIFDRQQDMRERQRLREELQREDNVRIREERIR